MSISIKQGDILFYRASNHNLIEDVIKVWENGGNPFVHVAIALDSVTKIEALGTGITLNAVNNDRIAAKYEFPDNHIGGLQSAIDWLKKQVNQSYGWADIFDAFLQKFEDTSFLLVEKHYDCSALATNFLLLAGVLGSEIDINPHLVTPQHLADILGVK